MFRRHETSRLYRDGEIILPQGDRKPLMGLIESGRVEVFEKSPEGEEIVHRVLHANDSFGVDSLFGNRPRRTGVRAAGKARVAIMDRRDFIRRTQEDPRLTMNVLRSACRRIRELDGAER